MHTCNFYDIPLTASNFLDHFPDATLGSVIHKVIGQSELTCWLRSDGAGDCSVGLTGLLFMRSGVMSALCVTHTTSQS